MKGSIVNLLKLLNETWNPIIRVLSRAISFLEKSDELLIGVPVLEYVVKNNFCRSVLMTN